MKRFDLINTPLDGPILIEASAGTGKTYSISGLFVRLIIEQGLGVEQILVVTYTTAATQELKSRIRESLIQTGRRLTQGSNDFFISGSAEPPPQPIDEETPTKVKQASRITMRIFLDIVGFL